MSFARFARASQYRRTTGVLFPALWLCAIWFSDKAAAIAGVVWVVGRMLYALAYLKEPSKRGAGFAVAMLAALALWLGAIVGLTGLIH